MVKSGQAVACTFTTRAASGAITDADSLPTATLHVNGAAAAEVVTVTNIRTGVYRASVTLPALSAGDIVEVLAAATVDGISDEAVIWGEVGDTARPSDLATAANLSTLAGYVDTEVAAIKAKTDNLPSDPADQSRVDAAIAALNNLSASEVWAGMTTAAANKIADHTLRRSFANAAASSDGDALGFRSLLGAVAKLVNRVAIAAATLTVYREDDTTALGTQAVTSDAAAEPVTGVNTN